MTTAAYINLIMPDCPPLNYLIIGLIISVRRNAERRIVTSDVVVYAPNDVKVIRGIVRNRGSVGNHKIIHNRQSHYIVGIDTHATGNELVVDNPTTFVGRLIPVIPIPSA